MSSLLSGQTSIVNIANDSCEVYIGRGVDVYAHMLTEGIEPGTEGWLGNPHPIGWCKICDEEHNRSQCIERFRIDFQHKLNSDTSFRDYLSQLRGKKLGCYCKPKDCHGDIIKSWLDDN